MSEGLQPRQTPASVPVLRVAQLVLCAAAVGGIAWETVDYAKQRWIASASINLKPWTRIFFHPDQSALFNYLGLCLCLALVGVLFYGLWERRAADPVPEQTRERSTLVDAVVFCSAVLVMSPLLKPALRVVLLTGIALHPFFWHRLRDVSGTFVDRCALAVAGLLVVLLCADPVALFVGPTRLMSEYPDLFGETLVEGKYVNNRTFLDQERSTGDDTETSRGTARGTGQQPDTATSSPPAAGHYGYSPLVKTFHRMNRLEYWHQNMGRGQINHIGHVLNPINEVASGRPLRDVYVQYGVGNTWLLKFVMDVFGGPAYHTWYRCYILYIIYFLMFTYAAWVLFRQPLFVLGSVAGLAFAYFLTGFIGFVLAPGVIPSIHLLDASLVIALICFFKRVRVASAVPVLLCTLAAMLLNPTFGLVTAAAAMAASLLFVLERSGRKLRWVLAMSVAFAAIVLLPTLLLKTRSDHVFRYFLLGYFSWEPPDLLPPLTILYLAVSYGFAFLLRESRDYLKYVYVYVFVYAQGLLLYFYWSGLTNHLPMAIPFLTLQFLLMIFIGERILVLPSEHARRSFRRAVGTAVIIILLAVVYSGGSFYSERRSFYKNFNTHRVYQWDLDKARVLSTMDPAPFREAVRLVQRYSQPPDSGIYIISKYDCLLPFLAGRYSLMPMFDMSYAILTEREFIQAVRTIKDARPPYLFVDSDLGRHGAYPPHDAWSWLYDGPFERSERTSRLGRYQELYRIYQEVLAPYDRVDEGQLISVYRRRDGL